MRDPDFHARNEASHIMGEMAATQLFALFMDRLEELAQREGITQADVARRLGLSVQQVSRWLTHPRNMTVKSAGRLMHALDANLMFYIDRAEHHRELNCVVRVDEPLAIIHNMPGGSVAYTNPSINFARQLENT